MDDFEKNTLTHLHHYLKIWADPYRPNATGEIKGGMVNLAYQYLIITSNYTIEECLYHAADEVKTTVWSPMHNTTRNTFEKRIDDELREALLRRFI